MSILFAPGCALSIYNRELVIKTNELLKEQLGHVILSDSCCLDDPEMPCDTIITACPGCDKKFRELFPNKKVVSLWEVLCSFEQFLFPDYGGVSMTIQDACPVRDRTKLHDAVRLLLKKMNITVTEDTRNKEKVSCCGDKYYGRIPDDEVLLRMKKRADEMPEEAIVVYCVSCVKAFTLGGKTPKYLLELCFSEDTIPGECGLYPYHLAIDSYREHLKERQN